MIVLQVIAEAACVMALVAFLISEWRRWRSPGPERNRSLNPNPVRVGAALGAGIVVLLLVTPSAVDGALAGLVHVQYFSTLQYLAPTVAAAAAIVVVPLVFGRPSAGRRVASLRPRMLEQFVDRPVSAVVGAPLGVLAVLGCMLWQALSSVDILWAQYTPTSNPSERIQVSERVLGFAPGWQELIGLAIAVSLLSVLTWTVLRRIRDAAPAERGELSSIEVMNRRMLSRYVLFVSTSAQLASAGFAILSAGQFLQDVETSPVMGVARRDPYYGIIPRQIGVDRLQPEWFLATTQIALGVVLLAAAAATLWQAFRVIRALSSRVRATAPETAT